MPWMDSSENSVRPMKESQGLNIGQKKKKKPLPKLTCDEKKKEK
jgi:hypothetical protein